MVVIALFISCSDSMRVERVSPVYKITERKKRMWTFIYRHKKAPGVPIAIVVRCEDLEGSFPLLEEKIKQAAEMGIELPPAEFYELATQYREVE